MALVPSSSLWSSIKIPFCLYSNRKIVPTIPYVAPCKDYKQRSYNKEPKLAREMVNLKVPAPLGKTEENPVPHLRPFFINHKKRTRQRCSSKSKVRQIGCVVVPGGDFLGSNSNWEEICNGFEKAILNSERATSPRSGEDFNLKWRELNLERLRDDVPTVKPWAEREQAGVTRKQGKTAKMSEDGKHKTNKKEEILIKCKGERRTVRAREAILAGPAETEKHRRRCILVPLK